MSLPSIRTPSPASIRPINGAAAAMGRLGAREDVTGGGMLDDPAMVAQLAMIGMHHVELAHDMRGLLTGLMIEAERLRQDTQEQSPTTSASGDAEGIAERLLNRLDAAVSLFADLIDFASARDVRARVQTVPLRALVDQAIDLALVGSIGAVSVTNNVPRPARVRACPHLLTRVFYNLIRNALAAARQAPDLRIEMMQSESGTATILVRDNGPGLPKAIAAAPFELHRPGPTGTGLGLAASRRMMLAQGGDLTLDRTGPEGTTFQLSLPAVHATARNPAPEGAL